MKGDINYPIALYNNTMLLMIKKSWDIKAILVHLSQLTDFNMYSMLYAYNFIKMHEEIL